LQPGDIDQDAAMRLFAIPHAGGGALMFRDWQGFLPKDIALQGVQLPGRQDRVLEPAFTEVKPLVQAICDALEPELDTRPYALLGHSLGGLLAYRVAVELAAAGAGPALVGVVGWAPEGFTTPPREMLEASEAELVGWLIGIGSLPPAIYADPAVLALTMPPTRADLLVCADYIDDGAKLSCPLVTYNGRSDPLMDETAVPSWRSRCEVFLGNCEFPGDHFFIHDHALAITIDLARHLRRCAAQPTG
jgi:surfactin synthase thioesterase subunit